MALLNERSPLYSYASARLLANNGGEGAGGWWLDQEG